MKKIGNLGLFGFKKNLLILYSHEELDRVRFIVSKAPEEAQWFHRVERIETQDNIVYRVHGTYVPEQYCSGAEVETTPEMQMRYFQELSATYGGMEAASQIVRESGAWCHSHVNMSPGPSGTDHKTFEAQVAQAERDGNLTPQIMMIFNKKDEYYSRVYDPVTGFTLENVQIITPQLYDFSELEQSLKGKFRERPRPAATPTAGYTRGSSAPPFGNGGTEGRGTNSRRNRIPTVPTLKPVDISPLDGAKFASLIGKINTERDNDEHIKKLIEVTGKYLEPADYIAMSALLWGNPEALHELEARRYMVASNTKVKEGIKAFWANLAIDVVEPIFLFERAVEVTIDLHHSTTDEMANAIIAAWVDTVKKALGDSRTIQ